jgi:membrane protein DedA with SNARE-associated domain
MDLFNDVLKFLEPYLANYGYPVLFITIFIESFGIPAPGQTLLIAAAILAVHGKLSITLVLLTALLAAVSGDSIGYWIGSMTGRRLILRFSKYVGIKEPQVHRMEATFEKYGGWFVTFARFVEVLRQVNGIVAGAAAMSFRRFLLFNTTGALLWVGVWGLGTYRLGRHLQKYAGYFDEVSLYFIVAIIVALAVLFMYFVSRHWHDRSR